MQATNKIQPLLPFPNPHEDLPRLLQIPQVTMIPLHLRIDTEILLDSPDGIGARVPAAVDQNHFGFGLHEPSGYRVSTRFAQEKRSAYFHHIVS